MPKEDYSKFFKVLEIDSSASAEEIRRAYLHLKQLYSAESVITLPIEDEYPEDKKKEILMQVEEAYMKLSDYIVEKKKEELEAQQVPITEADTIPEEIIEIPFTGEWSLKDLRENMSLSLNSLSLITDIPYEILENIELEKYDALPEAGLVRWYVLTVAKHLNLNAKETADEYMKRYRQWQKNR